LFDNLSVQSVHYGTVFYVQVRSDILTSAHCSVALCRTVLLSATMKHHATIPQTATDSFSFYI